MVSCNSITVTLVSIPDVQPVPEYVLPNDDEVTDTRDLETPALESSTSVPFPDETACTPETPSVASVIVPLPPAGLDTFWVHYKIAPPWPPNAYYYFKMDVDGEPILSWGVGAIEGFRGTVTLMPVNDADARTFHFSQMNESSGVSQHSRDALKAVFLSDYYSSKTAVKMPAPSITVRVYRANGRRYTATADPANTADFPNGCGHSVYFVPYTRFRGRTPGKYRQYSLVDELDSPFATFRYYFSTEKELQELGFDKDSPINKPYLPREPSVASTLTSTSSELNHSNLNMSVKRFSKCLESEVCDQVAHLDSIHCPARPSTYRLGRPLSSIGERAETPDSRPILGTTALHDNLTGDTLVPCNSPVLSSRSSIDTIINMSPNGNQLGDSSATNEPSPSAKWPLNLSKPLPDPPEDGPVRRPYGDRAESHKLLMTRFPKFSSSSSIISTSTLRSSPLPYSDSLDDPFAPPDSPLGRGDLLQFTTLSGGLRSHPTHRSNTSPPLSWISGSTDTDNGLIGTGRSPSVNGDCSSAFARAYAKSLDQSFLQRSDSVNPIGRAVSRPLNQRPPTPSEPALDEVHTPRAAEAVAKYPPKLGTPPVFFPHIQNLRVEEATQNESDDSDTSTSTIKGPDVAHAVKAPAPRRASSPMKQLRNFPVRDSSLKQFQFSPRQQNRGHRRSNSDSSILSATNSNAMASPVSAGSPHTSYFARKPIISFSRHPTPQNIRNTGGTTHITPSSSSFSSGRLSPETRAYTHSMMYDSPLTPTPTYRSEQVRLAKFFGTYIPKTDEEREREKEKERGSWRADSSNSGSISTYTSKSTNRSGSGSGSGSKSTDRTNITSRGGESSNSNSDSIKTGSSASTNRPSPISTMFSNSGLSFAKTNLKQNESNLMGYKSLKSSTGSSNLASPGLNGSSVSGSGSGPGSGYGDGMYGYGNGANSAERAGVRKKTSELFAMGRERLRKTSSFMRDR